MSTITRLIQVSIAGFQHKKSLEGRNFLRQQIEKYKFVNRWMLPVILAYNINNYCVNEKFLLEFIWWCKELNVVKYSIWYKWSICQCFGVWNQLICPFLRCSIDINCWKSHFLSFKYYFLYHKYSIFEKRDIQIEKRAVYMHS